MKREVDKSDGATVVTVDKAEMRRRIEDFYAAKGNPLPPSWILEINMQIHKVSMFCEEKEK